MAKSKTKKLEWEEAREVERDIKKIVKVLELSHVNPSRIFCYRTYGSKSRAYARIWTFPKIFQDALKIEPAYVIEVLAKYYDKLDDDRQKQVLIHELLHIPKNFSGALLPHRGRNRHLERDALELFREYKRLTR
jgi:predicted metallopeptidase